MSPEAIDSLVRAHLEKESVEAGQRERDACQVRVIRQMVGHEPAASELRSGSTGNEEVHGVKPDATQAGGW
ncbi:hypothetical protein MMC18_004090 [Xylographa bjoerkii]|nr:hypothetical protein [Xylographa bjoerkii]